MHLALITAPAAEPLTAAEVKARIGAGAEIADSLVETWITAERQKLDGANGMLGRALITQTWAMTLDGFPSWGAYRKPFGGFGAQRYWSDRPWRYTDQEIEIPLPPLQAVLGITYLDGDGDTQTVDPATYRIIQGEPAYLVPVPGACWPTECLDAGSVTVTFRCGYGTEGDLVPEPIRQAIALGANTSRAVSVADPNVKSESVMGVSSVTYSTGGATTDLMSKIADLIAPFRVNAGIS